MGACCVASGKTPGESIGAFIWMLIATAPAASGGLASGHSASPVVPSALTVVGSSRGMHIGKPVPAVMVGLSASTVKRSSGVRSGRSGRTGSLELDTGARGRAPDGAADAISPVA